MGEIPNYIFSVGCPSIDALNLESLIDEESLKKFKIDVNKLFLLLIQHPVTSELNSTKQIKDQ